MDGWILYFNCSVYVFTTSELNLVLKVIAISSLKKNTRSISRSIYILLVQAVQILQCVECMFSFSFHTPLPGYCSRLCILFDRIVTVLSLDHHLRGKWFRFGGLMAWFMGRSLWQLMLSTCTW